MDMTKTEVCERCGGSGRAWDFIHALGESIMDICPDCQGRGKFLIVVRHTREEAPMDMTMLNGATITVKFIRWLKSDLRVGLYLLPDGRFIVGYEADGVLHEHSITPGEYAWAED